MRAISQEAKNMVLEDVLRVGEISSLLVYFLIKL